MFHATVVPARRGRATTVTIRGWGTRSGHISAHVRPGTCRRVSGPEHGFDVVHTGRYERDHRPVYEGRVTVPVAFAAFLARPHVAEFHHFIDYDAIDACARLS